MASEMLKAYLSQHVWRLKGLFIPNVYPKNWFETDISRISPAGLWTELEFKQSVGDFNADFKKFKTRWVDRQEIREYKHDLLQLGLGPNYFAFVTTIDIETRITVPDYAGHIVFDRGRFLERKKCPALHGSKVDKEFVSAMLLSVYHRYHSLQLRGK